MENLDFYEGFRPIKLSLCHVDIIVDIHNIAFDGFFLTTLGSDFLKTYYSSCLKSKLTVALGISADEDENIIGFAVGSINSSGYHKDILFRNIVSFILSLKNVIISNPSILLRLFLNLSKSPTIKDNSDYAELLSIAVLPEYKGFGVGKLLIDYFEESVKNRGVSKITLTTDYCKNDSVVKFYQKNNYRIFYDFIAYPNRRMYKMIKELK